AARHQSDAQFRRRRLDGGARGQPDRHPHRTYSRRRPRRRRRRPRRAGARGARAGVEPVTLGDLLAPAAAPAGLGGLEITGLALDSRAVQPGFLFAALPGVKAHGRDFIPQAVAAGAAAILASPGETAQGVPVIEAADPAARLAELAARFYPRQP